MHPRFSIEIDRRHGLVRIVLSGLFMPQDVADFFEARGKAHALLGCAPNQHLTLSDVREMKILPQETVAAFLALLADPAHRARRLAIVVAPTLVRSQALRSLDDRPCRCFADPAEAEAWLLEEDETLPAPVSSNVVPHHLGNSRPRLAVS